MSDGDTGLSTSYSISISDPVTQIEVDVEPRGVAGSFGLVYKYSHDDLGDVLRLCYCDWISASVVGRRHFPHFGLRDLMSIGVGPLQLDEVTQGVASFLRSELPGLSLRVEAMSDYGSICSGRAGFRVKKNTYNLEIPTA